MAYYSTSVRICQEVFANFRELLFALPLDKSAKLWYNSFTVANMCSFTSPATGGRGADLQIQIKQIQIPLQGKSKAVSKANPSPDLLKT